MIENEINVIVAVSENGVIGKDNAIPWKQKADMAQFKRLTMNNIVIMGSRTFDSLNRIPLRNRINVVISRNIDKYANINRNSQVTIFTTLEDGIKHADKIASNEKIKIFIIGGGSVYGETIGIYGNEIIKPFVKHIYLTKIHANIEGDTYFPNIDNSWNLISVVNFPADENNQYPYSFYEYKR